MIRVENTILWQQQLSFNQEVGISTIFAGQLMVLKLRINKYNCKLLNLVVIYEYV